MVRHIGVSNFDIPQLAELPYADAHGIGLITYSPMASGLPTGDWRRNDERFREPRLSPNLELVAADLTMIGANR